MSGHYRDSDGSIICFAKLSKQLGISRWGLMLRYFAGDRGELLRRPKGIYGKVIEYNNRFVTLNELAKEAGVSYSSVYLKWRSGKLGKEGIK